MALPVSIDPRIWELRPDFVVAVVRASGLKNGPSDDASLAMLRDAERKARAAPPHPHIAAWREAFKAFGAKPQRTSSSAEALLKRVVDGNELPGINRLVDVYNAISLEYTIPVGGEDLDHYEGMPRLTRADGTELFETARSGEIVNDPPAPGEVVWRDDAGVTCRRWNWRQCVRTRLTQDSSHPFFVLERLDPFPLTKLREATDDLIARMQRLCGPATVESWIIER